MKRFLLLIVVILALAACAPALEGEQPPAISYGQDLCDECGMLIDDARFAAATIDLKGNPHKFDDIGGMLVYHMDHPQFGVRAYFVHDYSTQTWLRGETAFYVRSPQIQSPMDDGIAAFADRQAAASFAERTQGTVYKFDELRVNVHLTVHAAP
jgi:copper chaperone NosL